MKEMKILVMMLLIVAVAFGFSWLWSDNITIQYDTDMCYASGNECETTIEWFSDSTLCIKHCINYYCGMPIVVDYEWVSGGVEQVVLDSTEDEYLVVLHLLGDTLILTEIDTADYINRCTCNYVITILIENIPITDIAWVKLVGITKGGYEDIVIPKQICLVQINKDEK